MRAFPSLTYFPIWTLKLADITFAIWTKCIFLKHTEELYGEEDIGVSLASLPFRDEEVRRPSENSWFIQEWTILVHACCALIFRKGHPAERPLNLHCGPGWECYWGMHGGQLVWVVLWSPWIAGELKQSVRVLHGESPRHWCWEFIKCLHPVRWKVEACQVTELWSLSLSWGSEVVFANKTENTAGQCCHCTVGG